MRCLSRVTDSILWNIIKIKNSSVFQNMEGRASFYFILGLWAHQTCLIASECHVAAHRDTFWLHTSFVTSTAILQNQYTLLLQTKEAISWFCYFTGRWNFCSSIRNLHSDEKFSKHHQAILPWPGLSSDCFSIYFLLSPFKYGCFLRFNPWFLPFSIYTATFLAWWTLMASNITCTQKHLLYLI